MKRVAVACVVDQSRTMLNRDPVATKRDASGLYDFGIGKGERKMCKPCRLRNGIIVHKCDDVARRRIGPCIARCRDIGHIKADHLRTWHRFSHLFNFWAGDHNCLKPRVIQLADSLEAASQPVRPMSADDDQTECRGLHCAGQTGTRSTPGAEATKNGLPKPGLP